MSDFRGLNETQRRAVTWGEGPLLLLAGPGSGKTSTITNRILFLLERGVPPERILVITFTREAASSMQQRFRRISDRPYPVSFGTFHSVFYHILQESGGFPHLKLLTGAQKKNLIFPILREYSGKFQGAEPQADPEGDAVGILSAISYYKNTGDLDRAGEKCPASWRGFFSEIHKKYDAAARGAGGMDFDDMLFACEKLLRERGDVRRYWQNRFSHILIDEFQDINPMQYEVVRLLSAPPHNIFAVGDDDQSIYGFRGSRPELMRRFEEDFRAGRLLLDLNYRSSREIIAASLAVIGENRERFPKSLRAAADGGREETEASGPRASQDGEALRLKAFRDRETENAYLIRELAEWQRRHGEDGKCCAVLFRTNLYMQGAAAGLKKAGIPFQMNERTQSIYEHFIVRDVMAYLLLAAGDWRREYLLRVINRPSRYVGREAVGDGRSIREIIQYYEDDFFQEELRRKVRKRLELLQGQMDCLRKMRPALAVSYVRKAMGYEAFLMGQAGKNEEKAREWRELLEWLRADAARFGSVEEWLWQQKKYTAELERRPRAGEEAAETGIRLMTIHGAKGLEFDRVYVPDCNERVLPQGSMPDAAQVEEERRLLYVAMTRAKESLELLYLLGDRLRPRLPSRFLNPLLYDSPSSNSSNSQLSRYSSKASETCSNSSSSEM